MGTKITVELPDWAEDRHIYIFAGVELLAAKMAGTKDLLIKTERCNNCGKCCRDIPSATKFPFPVINGTCANLIVYTDGKTTCRLGIDMPFSCLSGNPILHHWKDGSFCSIRFKKEPVDED